jgi:hypothetical protein
MSWMKPRVILLRQLSIFLQVSAKSAQCMLCIIPPGASISLDCSENLWAMDENFRP